MIINRINISMLNLHIGGDIINTMLHALIIEEVMVDHVLGLAVKRVVLIVSLIIVLFFHVRSRILLVKVRIVSRRRLQNSTSTKLGRGGIQHLITLTGVVIVLKIITSRHLVLLRW